MNPHLFSAGEACWWRTLPRVIDGKARFDIRIGHFEKPIAGQDAAIVHYGGGQIVTRLSKLEPVNVPYTRGDV